MIGRTISHYKVTAKLGTGGMGVLEPEFERLYPYSNQEARR